jgi:hypothetical protein
MVVVLRVVMVVHTIAPVIPVPPTGCGIVLAAPAILFVEGFF